MKSVLDRLRDEDRGAVLALTAAERVALALALGERDLEAFRRVDAARILDRQKQYGRRASACLAVLIG
ncbi:MAG: hypothetical protein AUH76_18660 [Candidatus Rokubacteria bacterium 13_1_40CM_4_67_11]|nr:MAG: hypothetical protein AUH76_18660 [Candidatus Rokubacteria bacterium 13_1_40CM_4_67_11]